jgi:hypothetical protein
MESNPASLISLISHQTTDDFLDYDCDSTFVKMLLRRVQEAFADRGQIGWRRLEPWRAASYGRRYASRGGFSMLTPGRNWPRRPRSMPLLSSSQAEAEDYSDATFRLVAPGTRPASVTRASPTTS